MTPFVIDNQKTRRYITVFVLLLIVSFALGYASGFYMAKLEKVDGAVISDMPSVPEQLDSSTQDELSPDTKEKSDATTPQPEIKSEVSPPAKTEKNAATAAPQKITKSTPAPSPISQAKETKSPPEKSIAEKKPEPVKAVTQQPESARSVAVTTKVSEVSAEDQKNQAKTEEGDTQESGVIDQGNAFQTSQRMFSVQVGVFANQENALNLVEELKAGGFDAYLDDFVASGGEVKYNVRFGRESDRGLIQQQLSKYKQQFSTSAYIIISK